MTRVRAFVLMTVLSLAAPVAALAPAGPASAQDTSLSAYTIDQNEPHLVTLNGEARRFYFGAFTDGPTTVTATASGSGLVVSDAVQSQPTVAYSHHATITNEAHFYFHVTASVPGVHSLTVTFTRDGVAPVAVTVPVVVTPGSLPVARTGSLAGLTLGWDASHYGDYKSPTGTRDVGMLTFVDERFVYSGLPPAGRPVCTKAGHGCLAYVYDAATGLFRIGDIIVGSYTESHGFYIDGWTPAPTAEGAFWGTSLSNKLTFPRKGTTLAGRWSYRSPKYRNGIWAESLTLGDNGRYRLSYRRGGAHKPATHASGRYQIRKAGKIVFYSRGRVFSIGTVVLPEDLSATSAAEVPLWLVLSGKHGKRPDGNELYPPEK